MSEFNKIARCKLDMQKFLYARNEQMENDIKHNITICIRNIK